MTKQYVFLVCFISIIFSTTIISAQGIDDSLIIEDFTCKEGRVQFLTSVPTTMSLLDEQELTFPYRDPRNECRYLYDLDQNLDSSYDFMVLNGNWTLPDYLHFYLVNTPNNGVFCTGSAVFTTDNQQVVIDISNLNVSHLLLRIFHHSYYMRFNDGTPDLTRINETVEFTIQFYGVADSGTGQSSSDLATSPIYLNSVMLAVFTLTFIAKKKDRKQ